MDQVHMGGNRYAGNVVGDGKLVTLMEAATDTTAAVGTLVAAVTGLQHFRQAMIVLHLTNAAAAVGDTLDVYVDSSPDGTSWLNVVHFTQILGNGTDDLTFFAVLDPGGAPGTAVIAATSDCAAGVVRPAMFADQLRVRYTIVDGGAHGQSFSFGVQAFVK